MSRKAITLKGYSSERTPLGDPPAVPKHRSKKDTKRWCGGKPGLEHDGKWMSYEDLWTPPNTPQNIELREERRKRREADPHAYHSRFEVQVCQRCGKKMKLRDKTKV